MLAIISSPDQGLDLNLRAIKLAESSGQERARNWLGSLYYTTTPAGPTTTSATTRQPWRYSKKRRRGKGQMDA
jgi:hypothetical protein